MRHSLIMMWEWSRTGCEFLERRNFDFLGAVRFQGPMLRTCSLRAVRLIVAKEEWRGVRIKYMRMNQQPSKSEFGVGRNERKWEHVERPLVRKFSAARLSNFGCVSSKGISCSFGQPGKLLFLVPAITERAKTTWHSRWRDL